MELQRLLISEENEVLPFSIHKYSSSSSTYTPENILDDKPKDQSSRWSSNTISPPQFLILKLERPAIVKFILFGKYEKTHVCNLKRFKVFGGIREDDNFIELLDSGLKNDSIPESFPLRYTVNQHSYPCLFIKIVPIQSWGPIFNFSIWHISLMGITKPEIIQPSILWQEQFREKEAIRLCLKHFRQHNYIEIYELLQKKTLIKLENEILTNLHDILVSSGNFVMAESIIDKAIHDDLFNLWIDTQLPHPQWTHLAVSDNIASSQSYGQCQIDEFNQLSSKSSSCTLGSPTSLSLMESNELEGKHENRDNNEGESLDQNKSSSSLASLHQSLKQPQPRGGHQMVMDTTHQCIYLFGGWNGQQNLSDFWHIDVSSPNERWTLLSKNTELDGGPSPRSCHKMVLDQSSRHIFVLGRYLERELRDDVEKIKGDFYMYNLDTKRWILITDDTAAMGGPGLCFDHQMVIDQENNTIYVFGGHSIYSSSYSQGSGEQGHNLSSLSGEKRYSGLYSYNIPTNTWKKIRDDNNGNSHQPGTGEIRSRSNHSMVFHTGTRKLYIFGGQRKRDDYLNDFFTYDVDNDEIEIISSGNSTDSSIPDVGHTTRATIDCQRNEIHVMMGLNKVKSVDKQRGSNLNTLQESNKVISSFWVFNISSNTWTCLYRNDKGGGSNSNAQKEPQPRYAHQIVYNENLKIHYMFGGNPGGREGNEDKIRFGDFWSLYFVRPSKKEVLRICQLMIRKVQFLEMALDKCDPLTAMSYLQTQLSAVVDHDNSKEEHEFQLLASYLFKGSKSQKNEFEDNIPAKYHDITRDRRSDLFDELSKFFPPEMTQPKRNLVDLIRQELDN
ncbi:muskelin isoform X2 [Lepeophtheirus salmonis]|uniref:muskelin isoform X2 n=1 Tax=Lepeophtheirus salmonis TaxID=72036 RepID=UPI001AE2A745|nr:muskelin-like isoform X2 [Lepeophtheirus salmonis]